MTDRKVLEDIVTSFYEARAASDKAKLLSFAAPDFSFCIVASGKLAPMGQRVCEPALLDATVDNLLADWDMTNIKTTRLYIDDDTVFAHRAGTIRYNPRDKEVETEFIDRFTIKDGRIVDMTEFVDTLMIAETVGLVDA
ncbi:nuclear transport factor 2 family protein [Pararhizobium sp. BT-229]|uniref:nuclear transport factor 2 family protein n=1 Tax=Pararhizobium sp. BT-229 TaxID=2986923 RepID=UPI0021F719A8|nr:nuclear transport factor 2 family protein [Pararhizobium sp. BT-229]MCV9960486.1 nuclear transport factor 2 family protein [Pararhizobium sp. BT-229]